MRSKILSVLEGVAIGMVVGALVMAIEADHEFQRGYQAGKRSGANRVEVVENALRQCRAHPQQLYANNHPMKRMWFTGEKKWPE